MGGTGSYDPYRPTPGGASGAPAPDCLELSFVATVQVPATPIDVDRRSILEIVRTTVDGALIVGTFDAEGRLVGSIIDELERLLPCLSNGIAFVGEVIVINYGVPTVRISASSVDRVEGDVTLRYRADIPDSLPSELSVALEPEADPLLTPRVVAVLDGDTVADVSHARQAELRSLLRVGLPFAIDRGSGEHQGVLRRR